MAEIVLGMALSHTPQLNTAAEDWNLRLEIDKKRTDHIYRGIHYGWDGLLEVRKDDVGQEDVTLEQKAHSLKVGHEAIDDLASYYEDIKPDVAVIIGNDQKEMFSDDIQPAFTVYCAEKITNRPRTKIETARMARATTIADHGHIPPEETTYDCHPELANHIIKSAIKDEFDVSYSNEQHFVNPDKSIMQGIPHAFGFIYRQIMKDKVIANVPIIQNTFYPPNQPTLKRCFDFGKSIGRSIQSWESDSKVGIFASGGLSHFVVDEEFDQKFLKILLEEKWHELPDIDEAIFQSGTSECKNWVTAAGILSVTELKMNLINYQTFYRSLGGIGTGTAFAAWK